LEVGRSFYVVESFNLLVKRLHICVGFVFVVYQSLDDFDQIFLLLTFNSIQPLSELELVRNNGFLDELWPIVAAYALNIQLSFDLVAAVLDIFLEQL